MGLIEISCYLMNCGNYSFVYGPVLKNLLAKNRSGGHLGPEPIEAGGSLGGQAAIRPARNIPSK